MIGLAAAVGTLAAFRPAAAVSRSSASTSCGFVASAGGGRAVQLRVVRRGRRLHLPDARLFRARTCRGGLPLLIGELTLLAFAARGASPRMARSGLDPAAVRPWIGFNAVLTVRDFGPYGIDAVRDAAMWYYAGFVLIGAATWKELGSDRFRAGSPCCSSAPAGDPARDRGGGRRVPPTRRPVRGRAAPARAVRRQRDAPDRRRDPVPDRPGDAPALAGLVRHRHRGRSARADGALQVRAAFVGLAGAIGVLVIYRLVRPVVLIGRGAAAGAGRAVGARRRGCRPTGASSQPARIVERQISTLMFLLGAVETSDRATLRRSSRLRRHHRVAHHLVGGADRGSLANPTTC